MSVKVNINKERYVISKFVYEWKVSLSKIEGFNPVQNKQVDYVCTSGLFQGMGPSVLINGNVNVTAYNDTLVC